MKKEKSTIYSKYFKHIDYQGKIKIDLKKEETKFSFENGKLYLEQENPKNQIFLFKKNSHARIYKKISFDKNYENKIKIIAQDFSDAQVYFLQKNKDIEGKQRIEVELGRGANLKLIITNLGGKKQEDEILISQKGIGSRCEHYQASMASKNSVFKLNSEHFHFAKDTYSRTIFHFAATDKARFEADALVSIEKSAKGADTHLLSRGILLSQEAFCKTIPKLSVKNYEVFAGHGSALTPINQEELFYMQSRGIEEAEGKRMIVSGFLAGLLLKSGVDKEIIQSAIEDIEEKIVKDLK
jgi:Fe-S cluster assembly protein SufD